MTIGIIILFIITVFYPISLGYNENISYNIDRSLLPTSNGNTLYVGGTGEGNYSSIQEAINDSSYGDTVFVYNGTYYENVVINKYGISLIGEDKEITIIDGSGKDDVVLIDEETAGVTISGFTIQNSGNDIWDDAGIDIHAESNTITGNIITNNGYHGIYCNIQYYPWVGYNTIFKNIITNNELGIALDGLYNNEVYENYIANNKQTGIFVGYSLVPSGNMKKFFYEYYNNIYRNTITNNEYGIKLFGALYTNIFENNITNNVDGIRFYAPYSTDCNNNNVYQNNISNNRNGVKITVKDFASAEDNEIYHNNFIGNTENAYDEGNNIWDNGSIGNYWDDYTGIDLLPPYGIGDMPYNIPPRLLYNRDRHPLMAPWPDLRPHNHNLVTQNSNSQRSSQQSTNPLMLRFFVRFPLLEVFLRAMNLLR